MDKSEYYQQQQQSILHSEKINKKATYKNKFQQFQEKQQQQMMFQSPVLGSSQQAQKQGRAVPQNQGSKQYAVMRREHGGYGSLDDHVQQKDSIEGSFDQSVHWRNQAQGLAPNTSTITGVTNHTAPGKKTPHQRNQTITNLSNNSKPQSQVAGLQQNSFMTETIDHPGMGSSNAYTINLGPQVFNKKVKNLNEQQNGGKKGKFVQKIQVPVQITNDGFSKPNVQTKHFKEDGEAFEHNRQLKKSLMKAASIENNIQNRSIDQFVSDHNVTDVQTHSKGQPRTYQSTSHQKTRQNQHFGSVGQGLSNKQIHDQGMLSITDSKMTTNNSKIMNTITQGQSPGIRGTPNYYRQAGTGNGTRFQTDHRVKKLKAKNHVINEDNMVSIFDNTPIDMMPSVNKSSNFTGGGQRPGMQTDIGIGYVNYINGVPVSIQLNKAELMNSSQKAGGNIQVKLQSSWKQNMLRRNDLLNKSDMNKNTKQNPNTSMLPNINSGGVISNSVTKKIKPNYYKNKRKLNYSNMYEDEFGNLVQSQGEQNELTDYKIAKNLTASQTLSNVRGQNDMYSNIHSKKSLVKKTHGDSPPRDVPIQSAIERRAESMYVPKRNVKKPKVRRNLESQSRSNSPRNIVNTSVDKAHITPIQNKRVVERMNQSTSQKQNTFQISPEKTMKIKSRTKKNLISGSPKSKKDHMPYNGDGPINIEIEPGTGTARSGKSRTRQQSSKKVRDSASRKQITPIGVNMSKNFTKIPLDPSLFKIQVQKKHLEHLMNDDLDEISKFEVVYKILKDQLRTHQKKLIEMKEAEKGKKEVRNKSPQKDRQQVDWKEFSKHIKPFEWYGAQRDLSPEVKRIVKNLVCQEHQYMYCTCCKDYSEAEYDPITTINKFMSFIKDEQEKLDPTPKKKVNAKKKKPRHAEMQEDSVSEITDLDQEDVLAKYYEEKLSKIEKKRIERAVTRKRLRGETIELKHVCNTQHKKMKAASGVKDPMEDCVELELRQRSEGPVYQDEDQSAHQFSLNDMSVQADSEERLELEMQQSNADLLEIKSPTAISKASKSFSNKALVSNKSKAFSNKDSLFGPVKHKNEISIQTDGQQSYVGGTLKAKPLDARTDLDSIQTRDDPDKYRRDWRESFIYKKCMKNEAIKRGINYGSEFEVNEDELDEQLEMTLTMSKHDKSVAKGRNMQTGTDEEEIESNAQDADHHIGFMKKTNKKGNIQMLTESEILYIKTLLKKDTEDWENKSTLADLYRHCKFTIRKLTRQMANIDNHQIFKKQKVENRENTLFMVYRAERLYSALGDAEKIFKHFSHHNYDTQEFNKIYEQLEKPKDQEFTSADEKFVKRREHLLKRLQSQINNFLGQYSIFGKNFSFKDMQMNDLLSHELQKVVECKKLIDQFKKLQSGEIVDLSSKYDQNSVQKSIVTSLQRVDSKGNVVPKEPGLMSPYLSKVQIPDLNASSKGNIKSQSSARSILKSGRVNSNTLRKSKNKPKEKSKPQVYHNITEENKGGQSQRVGSMDSLEKEHLRESESHVNPMPSEMEDNQINAQQYAQLARSEEQSVGDQTQYTVQTQKAPTHGHNIGENKQGGNVLLQINEQNNTTTPRIQKAPIIQL